MPLMLSRVWWVELHKCYVPPPLTLICPFQVSKAWLPKLSSSHPLFLRFVVICLKIFVRKCGRGVKGVVTKVTRCGETVVGRGTAIAPQLEIRPRAGGVAYCLDLGGLRPSSR
ncbi:UNVERIFIED_CONTAM: hypothetical protein Sradi_7171000 [Sesamum radiatum]|uniref:Uncharacterized protein n=1 Tax=Sesamum radiatum TaxID=300843 RepID=A0AAW2IU15_SESRA